MRRLLRVVGWVLAAALVLVLLLLSPVVYVETACRGESTDRADDAILPPEYRRNEAASFLTYPEWHIVYAYDDYAKVIATGDPHRFDYWQSIAGFWSALCTLTEVADAHGGADRNTKLTIYTIGVSFTAELMLKAAYEETIGRFFAGLRGPDRARLDDLSAEMARRYATFLEQVPWYEYDFRADAAALEQAASPALRDTERRIALGIEFRSKAAYAAIIADAVAAIGPADLTIRSAIQGLDADTLGGIEGVTVIEELDAGTVIETPRYRAFTRILQDIAKRGGQIVEIAGNDDILLTATAPAAIPVPQAIAHLRRQGYGDVRTLMAMKVGDLAPMLRDMADNGIRLEHIHDY